MKRTITTTLGLILLSFIIMCTILQFIIFPSKIASEVSNDTWGSIISTFFAGTLGGLIAILGIWGQLNHEKKVKSKSVKIYLEHIKEINCNNHNQLFKIFIYALQNFYSGVGDLAQNNRENISLFKGFDSNYINQNLDEILKLKNAKDILQLTDSVETFNTTTFKNHLDLSMKKKDLLDSLMSSCPSVNLLREFCNNNTILLTYFYHSDCNEELLENFKKIQVAIINKCNTFKELKPTVLGVVNQKFYTLRLIKEKDIAKQALAIEAASKINSEILYLLQCEITVEIFALKDELEEKFKANLNELQNLKESSSLKGIRILEGIKIRRTLLKEDIIEIKEKMKEMEELLEVLREDISFLKILFATFNKIRILEIK